ncbi:hypothetical protein GmRootV15_34310 [Variovorax sp. V15]
MASGENAEMLRDANPEHAELSTCGAQFIARMKNSSKRTQSRIPSQITVSVEAATTGLSNFVHTWPARTCDADWS